MSATDALKLVRQICMGVMNQMTEENQNKAIEACNVLKEALPKENGEAKEG